MANLGYALYGANGMIPLTFTEIEAYMNCMSIKLLPSEVSLIKKLSEEYVSESYNTNPVATKPYIDEKDIKVENNSDYIRNKFSIFEDVDKK